MQRFVSVLFTSLLMSMVLVTSSCGEDPGVVQVANCLGDVALTILATVPEDAEALAIPTLVDIGIVCIDAAASAFSAAATNSTQVDINESSTETVITKTIHSRIWANCTDAPTWRTVRIHAPFRMFVGLANAQRVFKSRPSGNGPDALVAQALFDRYQLGNPTSQSSVIAETTIDIPAHTQVSLSFPMQIKYKDGDARLTRNGSSIILPWLFTDGFQSTGNSSINQASSNC